MGFECTTCDPPRSFKTASGMTGHRRMKHEAMAYPSVDHPQDGETTSKGEIQISDEDIVGLIAEHFDRLESKILSTWGHPAGLCEGEHCADVLRQHEATQRQRDVQIQQETAKWIFQQLDHVARDLGRVDVWDEFQRDYVNLANGIDHGPGFYIGSDRIVGGEEHPFITYRDTENGDVYHSPA